MSDMLEHRGYLGSVRYSDADEVLHGRLEHIRDLVTYEGDDVKSLKHAFEEAVDDYLEHCKELGRDPTSSEEVIQCAPRAGRSPASHDVRAPRRREPERRRHASA